MLPGIRSPGRGGRPVRLRQGQPQDDAGGTPAGFHDRADHGQRDAVSGIQEGRGTAPVPGRRATRLAGRADRCAPAGRSRRRPHGRAAGSRPRRPRRQRAACCHQQVPHGGIGGLQPPVPVALEIDDCVLVDRTGRDRWRTCHWSASEAGPARPRRTPPGRPSSGTTRPTVQGCPAQDMVQVGTPQGADDQAAGQGLSHVGGTAHGFLAPGRGGSGHCIVHRVGPSPPGCAGSVNGS